MSKIEFIEVNLSSTSSNAGTITVTLIRNYNSNPTTSSVLIEPHLCINLSTNATTTCSTLSSSIRLGSARHLGEDPKVNWGITTTGTGANSTTATLTFYGRAF